MSKGQYVTEKASETLSFLFLSMPGNDLVEYLSFEAMKLGHVAGSQALSEKWREEECCKKESC